MTKIYLSKDKKDYSFNKMKNIALRPIFIEFIRANKIWPLPVSVSVVVLQKLFSVRFDKIYINVFVYKNNSVKTKVIKIRGVYGVKSTTLGMLWKKRNVYISLHN